MRFVALIFACVLLSPSLIVEAQTASAGPAPASPCGTFAKSLPVKDGIVSETQGVDFKPYIQRLYQITQTTWVPLLPSEAKPPFNKSGEVVICFKILPSGKLPDGGMVLEGRSGDGALDRAAWGAIATSTYPPLPESFKGPYLEIRFVFLYNAQKPVEAKKLPKSLKLPTPPNLPKIVGMIRGSGSDS